MFNDAPYTLASQSSVHG